MVFYLISMRSDRMRNQSRANDERNNMGLKGFYSYIKQHHKKGDLVRNVSILEEIEKFQK